MQSWHQNVSILLLPDEEYGTLDSECAYPQRLVAQIINSILTAYGIATLSLYHLEELPLYGEISCSPRKTHQKLVMHNIKTK